MPSGEAALIATLGIWEVRPDPSRLKAVRIRRVDVQDPSPATDIEQEAGDFILRHVLEKDTVFFGG